MLSPIIGIYEWEWGWESMRKNKNVESNAVHVKG